MRNSKLTKAQEQLVDNMSQETIDRLINPKRDVVFKRLFGLKIHENVVKDFLEAILDTKIATIEFGKETILLPKEIEGKQVVLDVHLILDDGTHVDVEMQNSDGDFIIKRTFYYSSKLVVDQLNRAGKYQEIKKVKIIFILKFDKFHNIPKYHTIWNMREKDYSENSLDEVEFHYIELPKFMRTKFDIKKKIDQWLLFIDYSQKELIKMATKNNTAIKEAQDELDDMQKDKHLKYLAYIEEMAAIDRRSLEYEIEQKATERGHKKGYEVGMKLGIEQGKKEGIEQGKKEGIEQGKKEGIEQGKKEGIEQGKKEGMEQGIEQSKREIAKSMIEKGLDIKLIMELTGLSKEDIDNL